jgi:hypothetical protein
VQINLVASGAQATWPPNGWRLHGDAGTLLADGQFSYEISVQTGTVESRRSLPVPPRLRDAVAPLETDTQQKWAALAQDFVADVRGAPHRPYLTSRDGSRFEAAVDSIREGRGWTELPH